MSQSEYEVLLALVTEGFTGVHTKIDQFINASYQHRQMCAKNFAEIESELASDRAVEGERQRERDRGINWGKVKTALAIAVSSLLSIAAVKIIFTNLGKFQW